LTETQKRNLSLNPSALWKANPAQVEWLEARFAERLAAGEAEPKVGKEERVKQTLELAKLGPILEQKVNSWWSNRRQKQRKLDAGGARPCGASSSSPHAQAAAKTTTTKKKRRMGPYTRFCKAQHALGRGRQMKFVDFSKALGAEWRAMSEEEKAAWNVDEDADADGDEDGDDDGQD
jgi:hypothetical protein